MHIISRSKGRCALAKKMHQQPNATACLCVVVLVSPVLPVNAENLVTDWCQVSAWHRGGLVTAFMLHIRKLSPGSVKKLVQGQGGEGGSNPRRWAPGPAL